MILLLNGKPLGTKEVNKYPWVHIGHEVVDSQQGMKCKVVGYDHAIPNIKGARSRYFRQFQHWSNGHRIN